MQPHLHEATRILSAEPEPLLEDKATFHSDAVQSQLEELDDLQMMMPDVSRVLVIYTGGTIGMKNTAAHGYVPVPNYLSDSLEGMSRFHDPKGLAKVMHGQLSRRSSLEDGVPQSMTSSSSSKDSSFPRMPQDEEPRSGERRKMKWLITPPSLYGKRIRYAILEYDPLLDSSNMNMNDWGKIATDIEDNYAKFDAFIILHGTDTMAYTASALSFMLENLGKTVILTGSQVPISEVRNDGVENLLGALTIAGHFVLPEVSLYFNNRLFRGNRVCKVNAVDFNAFDSPNLLPLVTVGIHINVNWAEAVRPNTIAPFRAHKQLDANVATLRLFPGITEAAVRAFLAPPIRGIVLETFGAGNAPTTRKELLCALQEASDRGVIIVNISQCLKGLVSDLYATAKPLLTAGVVFGKDMTSECALAKLSYLLGRGYTPGQIRELMSKSLRGELTVRSSKPRFTVGGRSHSILKSILAVSGPARPHASGGGRRHEVVEEEDGKPEEMLPLTAEDRQGVERALAPILLCHAAASNDVPGIRELDDLYGTVMQLSCTDYDGRTPLHLAASEGHVEATHYLLLHGASVHILDRYGHSPLYDAARFQRTAVVNLLREAGAHLHEQEAVELGVRMEFAAFRGDLAMAKILVSAGVSVNHRTLEGRTPLHLAVSARKLRMVEYLFSTHSLKPLLKDQLGRTALDDARALWKGEELKAIEALYQKAII